ncbi:MAG: type VI secretion system tip protein VgrG [Planctomycetaceae bacterium]
MATWTQEGRPIGVETPFGADALVLMSFTGEEQISRLFSFKLSMVSEDGGHTATDIVGEKVDFWVRSPDGEQRWFNGLVNGFSYAGKGDRGHIYKAHVVPWMWLLTRGSDCRVHEFDEKKSAKDIIDGMLKELGFTDFKWDLKRTPEKRMYCVQYRETHFDFVSRLLEEEGIFYYFKHEHGKHTLVLTDHVDGVYDVKDSEVSMLRNLSVSEGLDQLSEWSHETEYTSGKWAMSDYNFETPSTSLLADTKSLVSLTKNSSLEFYDFPGDYMSKGVGTSLLKLRMEEEEASHETATGSSCCQSFSPGGRFQIKQHHAAEEEGKKWVLTAVEHHASLGGNYFGGAAHHNELYQNTFRCLPAEIVYRPPLERPKPRVMGMQSAKVVGPSGEEIYTDKYGRVKVQFPWDRKGKSDENSSLWVRVSTAWAGQQWGMIHIPRIGQEVLVSFLEGDPDRPVITGMLYNAEQMPPYGLPANKTQSGVKSHSSKGGSDQNFNEIRFEDKKDAEEIYIHAEKDLNCVIENNETRKVGYEDKDKGDQEVDIYNDQNLKVGVGSKGGSQTVEIFKDRGVTLKTGNDTLTLEQGDMSVVLKMGNQTTELEMGNQTTELKMGNQTTKVSLGKSSTQAMQSIELKVGGNSIKIDQTGVTIKGIMVKVEGQVMTEVKAPMTTVKGDAMLILKGGMTMIN